MGDTIMAPWMGSAVLAFWVVAVVLENGTYVQVSFVYINASLGKQRVTKEPLRRTRLGASTMTWPQLYVIVIMSCQHIVWEGGREGQAGNERANDNNNKQVRPGAVRRGRGRKCVYGLRSTVYGRVGRVGRGVEGEKRERWPTRVARTATRTAVGGAGGSSGRREVWWCGGGWWVVGGGEETKGKEKEDEMKMPGFIYEGEE
jgi:hypothetical protein